MSKEKRRIDVGDKFRLKLGKTHPAFNPSSEIEIIQIDKEKVQLRVSDNSPEISMMMFAGNPGADNSHGKVINWARKTFDNYFTLFEKVEKIRPEQ